MHLVHLQTDKTYASCPSQTDKTYKSCPSQTDKTCWSCIWNSPPPPPPLKKRHYLGDGGLKILRPMRRARLVSILHATQDLIILQHWIHQSVCLVRLKTDKTNASCPSQTDKTYKSCPSKTDNNCVYFRPPPPFKKQQVFGGRGVKCFSRCCDERQQVGVWGIPDWGESTKDQGWQIQACFQVYLSPQTPGEREQTRLLS